tara:strand:+ start:3293 stop:4348 length:1056 start_codon:yes stop_codon:yes gene_type:complete
MTKIVNEIPDELELEGEEVEVNLDPGKEAKLEKSTADVERVVQEKPNKPAPEFEIEEEDDTPPVDRGKDPLPDEIVEQLENDTLDDYSERVKQRMAQLKKVYHDERRAKESADREREEAIRFARSIAEENKKLKSTLSSGEEDYIKSITTSYEKELDLAKRDYREAYESGDTDKVVEAQSKMTEAQYKLSASKERKPQFKAVQQPENSVDFQQNTPQAQTAAQAPKLDDRQRAWQEENSWFGKDTEMTSLALGIHEKLVKNGVDPVRDADRYYRSINDTMQKRFPENFGDNSLVEVKPAQRKPSNVVAPATRSTAPKKVRLTKTQIALAKKFKLTPEQYARELIKSENANG